MRPRRPSRILALGAAACTLGAMAVPAVTAGATTGRAAATTTMLVFVRSAGAGDTVGRARAEDASVAAFAQHLGATVLARTTVPAALVVRTTSAAAHALSESPLVSSVLRNAVIPGPSDPTIPRGRASGAGARHAPVSPVACGTAAHPELDPEALSAINDVGNATLGYTGKGVKVAFLADGLQINVADFHRNRLYASGGSPAGSRVITSYQDFSGDGTAAATSGGEAFLDASSIAAQGNAIYDLDRYASAAHPLPRGCDVRIVGAAPGATVDALKIFGSASDTTGSGFIQAINYAVTHGVNVINESFGSNGFPDEATDIVKAADDAAVAAGVTVVASSGDAGVNSTIGSPASDPAVIGVGASTTFRAYQQDYFGGINLPGQHDRYLDDNISALSSGGVAQDGKTVDLVAPGDLNWALCSASPAYQDCAGLPFQLTGGTSESSPLTAGAAADVIEAYRASHHGTTPSPAVVKEILTSTASDVHAPADQQGAGLLDVGAAVRLALSMPGTTRAAAPGGLLVSAGQLDLSGQPSAAVMSTVSLTNTSTSAVHVTATTRGLEPFRVAKGHVTLDPSVRSRQPKLVIWSGAREVYQTAALRVLPGTSRVQLEAGYRYTNQTSLLHVALFTPAGQLAGYSNPQGIGDYADVEVADPAPGVWTAAFFTVWDGDAAGETGTTGPVPYTFTSSRWRGVGSAAPSVLSIGPGATRSITFRSTLPSTAGDSASSIVLRTQPAHVAKGTTPVVTETSIAVVERTMVPVGVSGGDFHGVLTGGNGRGGAPGQTNTYSFTVPAGKTDLDVGVAMSRNPAGGLLPADQLIGELVDPNGQTVAYDTNYTLEQNNPVATRYVDLYAAAPVAGTWSLVLDWAQPGTGVLTSIPFTGSVEFDQVSVNGTLPDSISTDVPTAGADFSVTVTDTGVAPMIVSPDARLTTTTVLALDDVGGAPATQSLPGAAYQYYVPTATSTLSMQLTATVPATFDASFAPGDPDLSPQETQADATATWSPTSASVVYDPPSGVTPGPWGLFPDEEGPYPTSGEPAATETTTTTATTLAFDATVTSPVTDTVEALTKGQTPNPDFVSPGSMVTIPITITPTGSVGAHESGTLFIDGFCPGSQYVETIGPTAPYTSVLAAIPYQYTVSA